MTIVRADLVKGRRGSISESRVRHYSIPYQVYTDSRDDGADFVLDTFVELWTPLGDVNSSMSVSASCEELEYTEQYGGSIWRVTIEYDSGQIEIFDNPLDQPIKWNMTFSQWQKVMEMDLNGKPIANTVGDLFTDPPYSQDDSRPVLIAKRNESSINIDVMAAYKDAVNADTWNGAQANTVKIKNLTCGDLCVLNGVEFYLIAYEFEYQPQDQQHPTGWQPQLLNRGHRAKDSSGNIVDVPNKEVRNLNQDGTPQTTGQNPYYIPFTTFKQLPFGPLNLVLPGD